MQVIFRIKQLCRHSTQSITHVPIVSTNTVPEHALLVMSRKSDACVLAEGGGTRVAVYGSHAVGALLATKQATFYCGVTQSGGFV